MNIDFDHKKSMSYDVLDSIVARMQPIRMQVDTMEPFGSQKPSEKMKLLDRESFRTSLQICGLNVKEGAAFPSPAFFLDESGYPNYEVKCYDLNMVDGIEQLIESFMSDGCANEKLDSICIGWADDALPTLEFLRNSTETDMLPPKVDQVAPFFVPSDRQVSKGETQSFKNSDLGKELMVYKWKVEYKLRDRFRGRGPTVHSMHVLLCRVVDI